MRYIAMVLLFLALAPAALAQDKFELEVMSKNDELGEGFGAAADLAMAGDVAGATKAFLALTEKDPSPAAAFVVGNLVSAFDRSAGYALHKKAFEAQPRERAVLLQWALEQHRKGEYDQAIALYRQYLKIVPRDKRINVLLADCLIRRGELKEAVAAWVAAEYNHDRPSMIDHAIYDVYGDDSPLKKRAELLVPVQKGDAAGAERLIDQDLNMEQDWWNSRVSRPALKHDLAVVQKLLGADSKRWAALQCWVRLRADEEPPGELVKSELTKAGLIIAGGRLPESSVLASKLLDMAATYHLDTRARLMERFGKALTERANSKEGDVEAVDALCVLTMTQPGQQAQWNRLGWERYHQARFAEGLLANMSAMKQLKLESPELARAVKDFPESSAVQAARVEAAGKERLTNEMLSAAIAAEFRRPSAGADSGQPDTGTLQEYFALLQARLGGGAAGTATQKAATRP